MRFFIILLLWFIFSGIERKPIERYEPQICSVEKINFEESLNIIAYNTFLKDLAFLESSGKYSAEKGQYKGKYQFGKIALEDIGYEEYYDSFLEDTIIQEKAMYQWLLKNESYLEIHINSFVNKKINGILITKSGLLAGAHLAGNYSVRRFLTSNGRTDFKDGNGTPVSKYIEYFSDDKYQFDLNNEILVYNYLTYEI